MATLDTNAASHLPPGAGALESDRAHNDGLPSYWRTVALNEVTRDFISGGTPSTQRIELWGGNVPWTTSAPIDDDATTLAHAQRYITEGALTASATHLVPRGNLLVGTRVGVGKAVVNLLDVAISQDLTGVILDTAQVVPEFVAYQFKSGRIQSFLAGRKRGTTIKGISRFDLQSVTLYLPPLPNQRAIARVLRSVQCAIQARSRELELEREHKAALMQHLFTKGTRGEPTKQTEIGEMPESWQVVELGSFCRRVVDCPHTTPTFLDSGVLVVRTTNVRDGKLVLSPASYTSEAEYTQRIVRCEPQEGDVLFSREAPVGEACLVPPARRLSLGQRMMLLRTNLTMLDASYTVHAFYSPLVRPRMLAQASGVTAKHLNVADVKRLPFPLAPLPEQKEIAHILNKRGARQLALERETTLLEELFRALLEELMYGRLSAIALIGSSADKGMEVPA